MPCSLFALLSSHFPASLPHAAAYRPLLPPGLNASSPLPPGSSPTPPPGSSPPHSDDNDAHKPGTAVGALRVVVQAVNLAQSGNGGAGFSRWRRAPRLVVRMSVRGEGRDRETGTVYETMVQEERNTEAPSWLSSTSAADTAILLYSLRDTLELEVLALPSLCPRVCGVNSLGAAAFSLGILEFEPRIVGAERAVRGSRSGRGGGEMEVSGTVLFDVFYYSVLGLGGVRGLEPKSEDAGGGAGVSVDAEKGGVVGSAVPLSQSGIVTLRVIQVKDLERNNDSDERPASTPCTVNLIATTHLGWSEPPIQRTAPTLWQPLPADASSADMNVAWNATFDFLCFDRGGTSIVVKVVEAPTCCRRSSGSGLGSGVVYGHLTVPLDDLLSASASVSAGLGKEEGQVKSGCWWPLSGCLRGALQVVAEWKSLDMPRKRVVHRRASS